MTEFSMFPWETQTGTGDGVFSYNQDQANNYFRYFDLQDPTAEGVGVGVLNELAVSTPNPNAIDVDTGIGVSYGRYWNDAVVSFAVADDVVIRGYNVVLQSDWALNETRLVLLASVDATIPTPAQTAGTLWEISLATFTKASGVAGAITLTDTRVFLKSIRTTDTNNLIDSAVTTIKIADSAVTPIKILDRTRTFWIPAVVGLDQLPQVGAPAYIRQSSGYNTHIPTIDLPTAVDNWAIGSGILPYDWVTSGIATIDVIAYIDVLKPAAVPIEFVVLITNLTSLGVCGAGALGAGGNSTIVAPIPNPPASLAYCIDSFTIPASTFTNITDGGNVIQIDTERRGTNVSDTYVHELQILGWRITYTADS